MTPMRAAEPGTPAFLAGLDAELVRALLADARRIRCRKDGVLHREGARPEYLHVLERGAVELSRMDGGQDCAVLLLAPGDIFSLGAVMVDEPYLTSARALGPATVLTIAADRLRQAAGASPALAARLLSILSGQWRTAVRQIVDLKCRTAPQRLAMLLLRLADAAPPGTPVQLPVAKGRLASRVGISPETLSRCLRQLSDEGLVVRGRQVIVQDRARAERFCGHDPVVDGGERAVGVRAL